MDDPTQAERDAVCKATMNVAPRPRMTHELKTWPEFFNETRGGRKKFELRRNDRDFQVGDELLLKEWGPHDKWCKIYFGAECDCSGAHDYTGRELLVRVDYILGPGDAAVFLNRPYMISAEQPDYVIMSISLVS